ncbi:MAG TPA: peroxiredoxin [Magnetospirillaceae bacterium]|nr:peroxiredoxin [Magnetospirillaceae bacterium]
MKQAQDFSLPDQTGKKRSLSEFKGKWVVLYFYPQDQTPGCTAEACSFRDVNEALLARDAVVIGISKDSVESHADFIKNYSLPFTLLADPDKKVIKMYEAWGPKMFGVEGTLRKTFIINPAGDIAREYPRVTPAEHATQILNDLAHLQKT